MIVFVIYQKANFMLAIIKKMFENKLTNTVCLDTVHSVLEYCTVLVTMFEKSILQLQKSKQRKTKYLFIKHLPYETKLEQIKRRDMIKIYKTLQSLFYCIYYSKMWWWSLTWNALEWRNSWRTRWVKAIDPQVTILFLNNTVRRPMMEELSPSVIWLSASQKHLGWWETKF